MAGFWRAIGIIGPAEPDHLSALLGLYASVGEAVAAARRPATIAALRRVQETLFSEHLWPWLPGHLEAVTDLPAPALSGWAGLLRRVIAAEAARWPARAVLPLALRAAPPGADAAGHDAGLREMAVMLTVPVRSGMILTRHGLALGAGSASVGHRIGERRFTLRAMLEQDPAATLGWLAAEASRWQRRHASHSAGDGQGAGGPTGPGGPARSCTSRPAPWPRCRPRRTGARRCCPTPGAEITAVTLNRNQTFLVAGFTVLRRS